MEDWVGIFQCEGDHWVFALVLRDAAEDVEPIACIARLRLWRANSRVGSRSSHWGWRSRARYPVTAPTYFFAVPRRLLPTRALDAILRRAGGEGRR